MGIAAFFESFQGEQCPGINMATAGFKKKCLESCYSGQCVFVKQDLQWQTENCRLQSLHAGLSEDTAAILEVFL